MRVTSNSRIVMTKDEWLNIGKKAGWVDNIPGGLADDECVCTIAKSHNVSVDLIKDQLKRVSKWKWSIRTTLKKPGK